MSRLSSLLLLVLALAGCGGAPEPSSTESSSSGGDEPQQALVFGSLQESEPPPPREPAIVPDVREVAPPGEAAGPYVALETAYAQVLGAPLGVSAPTATMQETVAVLVDQLERAVGLVRAVDDAARALPETDAPGRGRLRQADARAALAARAVEAPVALASDVEARISDTSEEVRAEIRAEVDRRIRETLAERLRPLWCQAAALYADVEALGGPDAEIARARRAAYGERFLASCAR